ncbi:MAG: metal-sensitive transcriptional regulator [Anaerolineales bacterium]|nr:metal-sensitive transcriptional regulator [Anaerolineales bacterium]
MNEKVATRLRTIQGHIVGIEKMVQEDVYCIDIIHQIQAVQSALSKVNQIILEDHLNSCVITAIQGDDPQEREKVIDEIGQVFERMNKK